MDREPRFYVGETVRIRQWDDMKAEWGGDSFSISTPYYVFLSSMQPLCGKHVTITDIELTNSKCEYFVEENVGGYHLTEEMLELIEPEPLVADGLVDSLCNMF